MSSHISAQQPDLLFPRMRRAIWIPFILAIGNGVFLYLFASFAGEYYAWSVTPPINAASMGAGYAAGVIGTGLSLFFAHYWRSIRIFIWPFITLSGLLVLATIIHFDRFVWSYPLTWIWALVYLALPPALAYVWFNQERAVTSTPPQDERLRVVRMVSVLPGLAFTLLGVLMFLSPATLLPIWPWGVTPLVCRCLGGWYTFAGLILLAGAISARQPYELIIPNLTLVGWNSLLLLLLITYNGSFQPAQPGYIPWIVLHIIGLLTTAFAVWMGISLTADRKGFLPV